MSTTTLLIKNGQIINRGAIIHGDIYVKNDIIEQIAPNIDKEADTVIDAEGKWVMPGIIDDQVHFREPGLTYKADIASESRAAIAGGVTTFMEMPNTKPSALTQELLQDKYDIAQRTAYSNYSFFMGASNENIEEVLKTDRNNVCGVKVFMGSSTGNMLVDNEDVLTNIFSKVDMLIATHCEDEPHTKEEKSKPYTEAPAGLPLIQHSLNIMLDLYRDGIFTLEQIVEKMCHTPAICFQIGDRGYLNEGYKADIAIIDPNLEYTVGPENIAYKCGWSPLEGKTFKGKNICTIVNGKIVYDYKTQLFRQGCGERLTFDR